MSQKVLVTREIPAAGLHPLEDFDVTVLPGNLPKNESYWKAPTVHRASSVPLPKT